VATASNNYYSYAYLPPPYVPQDPGTAPTRPGRMQMPSLPLYNGNTAEYQDWAMLVYAKLEGDGANIGDARKQIFHLLMALEGDARRYMVPWVGKNVINNPGLGATPTDFMKFLAEGFENTGAREEALMKLTSMKQGNRTFQAFLLEFNQTMYAAGQTEQEDVIKITYLKNALCRELLQAQSIVGDLPTQYSRYTTMLTRQWNQITEAKAVEKRQHRGGYGSTTAPQTLPTTSQGRDAIDLSAGTTRVATTTSNPPRRNPGLAEYPQAKWVTREIMDERRRSRCCMRCGNVGHQVSDCKFRPAINPIRAPRINTVPTHLNTAADIQLSSARHQSRRTPRTRWHRSSTTP
jgi:hypothetical protein